MARSLASIRTLRSSHPAGELLKRGAFSDPNRLFRRWLADAMRVVKEPHAMHLATATPTGRPSGRMVLLKGVSRHGFEFYTNYRSRKSGEIAANPHAALTFYWKETGRQVRVEGRLRKVPAAVSDRYFASRPRESRLGAWASAQSEVLGSRAELLERYFFYQAKFKGRTVPRPAWWGGYYLAPGRIEFWQSREGRLHDRILFEKKRNGKWTKVRLAP
jgi:pyridoxamine 5'-phosphate oxidase